MKLIDINPHIRCAQQFKYQPRNNHVYAKDCRLFYISSGKCKIHIQNNCFELNENTLFYCCGGSDYTFIADNEQDKPIQIFSINFDLTQNHNHLLDTFIPEDYNKTKDRAPVDSCHIEDGSFLNSYLLYENAYIFKDMIKEITKEFSLNGPYYREYSGTILKNILINLHRKNNYTSKVIPDGLSKAIEYINSNYNKEITNTALGKIAGYHEFYLNRLFNRHLGISMHKYIINLRIAESKYLLLNSDMPISDIAVKTGFNSNTHFSTTFKKELMMTPFEYRNKLRNNI